MCVVVTHLCLVYTLLCLVVVVADVETYNEEERGVGWGEEEEGEREKMRRRRRRRRKIKVHNTVGPRYSEPLKCGHLVLTDVLLRYGLHSHCKLYILTPKCWHPAIP